jgi:hypothetical protein
MQINIFFVEINKMTFSHSFGEHFTILIFQQHKEP